MPTQEWTEGDHTANQSNSGMAHSAVGPNPSDDFLRRGYEFGSVTKGLIVYYPFDEGAGSTANDQTELGNDASLSGTFSFQGSGQVGSDSISFGGGHASVPTPVPEMNSSESITFAFWIRENDTGRDAAFGGPSGSDPLIFAKTNEDETGSGVVNDISFFVRDDSGTQNRIAVTVSDITTWNHVVFLYDRNSEELRSYENGNLDQTASQAYGGFTTTSWSDFRIAELGDGTKTMQGDVDDFRVYNRALSQPEITRVSSLTSTSEIVPEDTI